MDDKIKILNGGQSFNREKSEVVNSEHDHHIDDAAKKISKALNIIESAIMDVECACANRDWDDGVKFQMQDGARELGFALATLCRWYDEV